MYRFYGDNPLPIYIGKSVNLRERVAAHFTGDWQSESDARLSQEIRRIEVEETAGELGALLREAVLVKTESPAHNRALRRKEEAGVIAFDSDGRPRYLRAGQMASGERAETYGPFTSKRSAQALLRAVAADHGLCWRRLGLEKRASGPCFQRQLRRCRGACVEEETPTTHDLRLRMALAVHLVPRWPLAGMGWVEERSADGSRTDLHVLQDWSWLGTARDESALADLLESPPRPQFDIDVARLLQRRWAKGTLRLVAAPTRPIATASDAGPDAIEGAYDAFTTS